MKKGFYFLLILWAVVAISSCKDTPTYTERLKIERDKIDRLIEREGLVILDEYPEDGVFAENEFVLLENGVYLNVIDSGNGNRPELTKTKVFCRFVVEGVDEDSTYRMVNNLIYDDTYYNYPTEFIHGYTVSSSEVRSYDPDIFVSEGLTTGLYYVGENALVKLIVPFKRLGGELGNNYYTVFFRKVKYTFEK